MSLSNTTILIRKSVVSGNTPTELANGEIAINSADGRLFYSDPVGNILSISNQDTFGTINANSTLVIALEKFDEKFIDPIFEYLRIDINVKAVKKFLRKLLDKFESIPFQFAPVLLLDENKSFNNSFSVVYGTISSTYLQACS